MENEYMTTQEVIKAFRITKVTLLKMIHEGRIRTLKVGNAYRFKKEWLEEDLKVSHEEARVATK
jgi:excisionase family DNA binding protein